MSDAARGQAPSNRRHLELDWEDGERMPLRKGLLGEASLAWREALVSSGLTRRKQDIYTRPVADEVLGWVGLNRATHRPDELLEVNPVVGVRHQPIEHMVADLLGRPFHLYLPPTMSIHLGYLMPQQRYLPWLFGEGESVRDLATEMAETIGTYGIAFMNEHTALPAIVRAMETGRFGYPHQTATRLPVGLLMLGQLDRAEQAVASYCDGLGDRQDPAAEHFRRFAIAFNDRIAVV